MLDTLIKVVPIIVSLISVGVAVFAMLHKTKIDRTKTPAEAAGSIASAAGALGRAYERRLQELEEALEKQEAVITSLTKRVAELEQSENSLINLVHVLGRQVEEAGLVPGVLWREHLAQAGGN